ncbi:MAG: ion transporter [Hyphomicrobium sp.]|nr:ion transporter [Hyphomicrobium sp.]
MSDAESRHPTARERAFDILEHGRRRDFASRVLDWILVLVILADVAATLAQTLPDIETAYGENLQLFDRLCVLVFAVEYAARLWVAPEHPLLHKLGAWRARARFAATPMMVIDALAFVPLLLELLFPGVPALRLTRLVRFLKLARYSPALATIGRVLAAERRALLACVIILGGVMLAAAAAMHAVEGEMQPERLGDMPKAMWWSAAMLAKIGGGELTPVTALGRMIAAITVMLGIFCFALPVAIIGRGFYEEIRRRGFRRDLRHGRPRAAVRPPRCGLDLRSRRHLEGAHGPRRYRHHPQGRAGGRYVSDRQWRARGRRSDGQGAAWRGRLLR